MRLRIAPFALLKRLALRLLLIAAVLWGGGIALFSVLPVPFSAVMLERQVSAWLSGDFHYLAHSPSRLGFVFGEKAINDAGSDECSASAFHIAHSHGETVACVFYSLFVNF